MEAPPYNMTNIVSNSLKLLAMGGRLYNFSSPRPSLAVIAGLTRNLMFFLKKIAGQARNDKETIKLSIFRLKITFFTQGENFNFINCFTAYF